MSACDWDMPGQRRKSARKAFPNPGNANIIRGERIIRGEHRHQLGPWLGQT
jgi:hypothetical protein